MSEELDRLAELEAKATPGPWLHGVQDTGGQAISAGAWGWILKSTMPAINAAHDVVFVCKLRNAAPALLAAARERDEWATKFSLLRGNYVAASRERDELLAWQREAVPWLQSASMAYPPGGQKHDELRDLLARVKP